MYLSNNRSFLRLSATWRFWYGHVWFVFWWLIIFLLKGLYVHFNRRFRRRNEKHPKTWYWWRTGWTRWWNKSWWGWRVRWRTWWWIWWRRWYWWWRWNRRRRRIWWRWIWRRRRIWGWIRRRRRRRRRWFRRWRRWSCKPHHLNKRNSNSPTCSGTCPCWENCSLSRQRSSSCNCW